MRRRERQGIERREAAYHLFKEINGPEVSGRIGEALVEYKRQDFSRDDISLCDICRIVKNKNK